MTVLVTVAPVSKNCHSRHKPSRKYYWKGKLL
nr:MAG TPA: hypothetical protein [Caudoviricetes sp.]